jgi:hypothetical protein
MMQFATEIIKKPPMRQQTVFIIGLLLFTIMGISGWNKLKYGFNFIDEGYHAVESWRLTQGDKFIDQHASVLSPYTLINALVFRIHPEMTMLGFRKLQFILAMLALGTLGTALYTATRQYWYIPFTFSLFAFTGLDPTGMMCNLNYYTLPHLFLTLHVSFLLFGVFGNVRFTRCPCFILSGLCLFGTGMSLLHLNVVGIAPVILYFLSRTRGWQHHRFACGDLMCVLIPLVISWVIFLNVFGMDYFIKVREAVIATASSNSHNPARLLKSLSGTEGYAAVTLVITSGMLFVSRSRSRQRLVMLLTVLIGMLIYWIIKTSCWGVIRPYYNGWFGPTMWLSMLLMIFVAGYWLRMVFLLFKKVTPSKTDLICLFILTPSTIQMTCTTFLSGLNALTVLHTAIPTMAAMTCLLFDREDVTHRSIAFRSIQFVSLLIPYYLTTVWLDWRFTYFDLVPEKLNVEISKGYGKGIVTNGAYAALYDWIYDASNQYSKPDDRILSYVVSPMVYMIANRRPAINNTFTCLASLSPESHQKGVQKMIESGKAPAMVFVFERMPVVVPVSMDDGTVGFIEKQFNWANTNDAYSTYVRSNMVLGGTFVLSEEHDVKVMFFVRPESVAPTTPAIGND